MKKNIYIQFWALEPRGGVTLQLKTNLTLEVLRSIEVALLISLSFSLLVNSHVLSLVLIILGWRKYVKLIGLRNYLMPWTIHIGSLTTHGLRSYTGVKYVILMSLKVSAVFGIGF